MAEQGVNKHLFVQLAWASPALITMSGHNKDDKDQSYPLIL